MLGDSKHQINSNSIASRLFFFVFFFLNVQKCFMNKNRYKKNISNNVQVSVASIFNKIQIRFFFCLFLFCSKIGLRTIQVEHAITLLKKGS
ncbi:hypothetical protein XENTR_v10003150 [Xenopus tropicalis]|nr:hypothetical protein XENTR_v10003150 [Xenopus tropicalis]